MSGRDLVARGLAMRTHAALGTAGRHGRLLRASADAYNRSAAVLPPWLAAPAYAPSTAYAPGQVVANGGGWYMCGIGGTTPPTGGGPATTGTGQYVPDGASPVYWAYLGGARTADPGDGAPAISVVTANPALGANWLPSLYPAAYAVRGATPTAYRDTFWSLSSFEAKPGVAVCAGAAVAFACDADRLALFLPANSAQVRLLVDGRYLKPGSHVVAGQDQWMVIDWTGSSGKRLRQYELEVGKSAALFGCVQTPTSAIVTAGSSDGPRMVVIGDSYNAGSSYGPWLAGGSIAHLLGKRLGWRDVWNLSVGGTGYCNASASTFSTFGERVGAALALNPDIIMVMGSSNDIGYAPGAVQAAVLATVRAIRAGTAAPIVVVGVPSINLAGLDLIEAAVAAGVAQAADSLTFFVPITGAAPPWVLGPWNNGAGVPAGTSNAALYVAADGVHPPEIGFDYYAQRIEQAIRAAVLPGLAGI